MIKRMYRFFAQRRQKKLIYKNLNIGDGTHVSRSNLDGMFPRLINIGEGCISAPASIVLTHDASYLMFTGQYRMAPVTIGNHVFVGYGSVVMPGVTIGDNVVIGAMSVVTKDVPSDCVAIGAPAKVTRSIAEYLSKIKPNQIFEPDYNYKANEAISLRQVLEFQKKVYAELAQRQKAM